jgi:SAM-dependent methyltransferase
VTRIALELALLRQFARLEPGVVLDVGSKASPYKDRIPHTRYLRLDLDPRTAPDLCCDVQAIECEDAQFDALIATEVLEHLSEPQRAVDEMLRVLRPGGACIASTRFLYPYHPDPRDYYRFTWDSLGHLFRRFSEVEVMHHGNRLQAVWTLLDHGIGRGLLRPFNPLIARVHFERTRVPLGFVVFARKGRE